MALNADALGKSITTGISGLALYDWGVHLICHGLILCKCSLKILQSADLLELGWRMYDEGDSEELSLRWWAGAGSFWRQKICLLSNVPL